jgi:hypothetical protein
MLKLFELLKASTTVSVERLSPNDGRTRDTLCSGAAAVHGGGTYRTIKSLTRRHKSTGLWYVQWMLHTWYYNTTSGHLLGNTKRIVHPEIKEGALQQQALRDDVMTNNHVQALLCRTLRWYSSPWTSSDVGRLSIPNQPEETSRTFRPISIPFALSVNLTLR